MKKAIIIVFVLITAGIIWFYPLFSPLSRYTDNCRKTLHLSKTATDAQNLAAAEENFTQCKIALAENDKKFKDLLWKTKPWCKEYGNEGLIKMIISPRKFKSERESNAILDELTLDSRIISSTRAKMYKNSTTANAILDEFKSIVTQYTAYCQLNNEPEMTEKHKQFIKEKFLNNRSTTKPKKQNIRPFK